MNAKVFVGLVAFVFAAVGFSGGYFTAVSAHEAHKAAVTAYSIANGCVSLGAPKPGEEVSKHIESGFGCQGVLVVITK